MPTEVICNISSFDLLLRRREGECERVKGSSTGNLVVTLVDLLLQCHVLLQFLRNGGRLRLDPFLNVLSWHMVLLCSSWQAFLLPENAGQKWLQVRLTPYFFSRYCFKCIPAVGDCNPLPCWYITENLVRAVPLECFHRIFSILHTGVQYVHCLKRFSDKLPIVK